MDIYLQALISLMAVLILVVIISVFIKKYHSFFGRWGQQISTNKTLIVQEYLVVDTKHKLVIIKRHDKRYLLMFGMQDTVIDSWEDK